MDEIKYFFECLIPITVCNFRCHYCYVIQRGSNSMKMPSMRYSPKYIVEALSQKRIGGIAYFSICGAGETLMVKELPDLVQGLLQEGHYINLTTNGTFTKGIDNILTKANTHCNRIQFAFSLHYFELLRTNKLDTFFDNINKVRNAGCSFLVQLNLCDEYEPYIAEIMNICKEKVGAYPQIAATRKENNLQNDIELYTHHTVNEYLKIGQKFDSPLFEFTMKNFNVKQKKYCLNGLTGGVINLETGIYKPCYLSPIQQNIFDNINKAIKYIPIGRHCKSPFCMNSSHFIAIGCIPSYDAPTYVALRNRLCSDGTEWYNSTMKIALDCKLFKKHPLTYKKRIDSEVFYYYETGKQFIRRLKNFIKKRI